MKTTQDLINSLSVEQKIKLFNGVGNWHTYSPSSEIRSIMMCDGPHGLRKQQENNYSDINQSEIATCFPTGSCIASSWDKNALALLGKSIALEAKKENVDLILGPGMNIKRSPLCGRNFEYYSEDPYLSGTLAASYVNAMQEEGVGSCVKHFACNNQEKRRQTSSSNVNERTLHEIYLRGFEIAVKSAQPHAIMCSYNKLNGTFVCHNKYLLTDILRKKWGYKGIVISDWGACIDAAECVKAGMDLAMPNSFGYFDAQLKKALDEKTLSEEELERANKNLLSFVKKHPEHTGILSVDYNLQHKTALELATQSAVLLKSKGLFPLKPQRVIVIGELAEKMKFQGGGSSHINAKEYPDAVEALTKKGFDVLYTKGYYSQICSQKEADKINEALKEEALEILNALQNENLPVLFFCGLTEKYEGEGFDRKTLSLPKEQLDLLSEITKITKNVGVVSFSGAPYDVCFEDDVNSILHMYLCGEACGEACAELICGDVNPSGKLAETWPYKIEDTPCYGNFALDDDEVDYKEEVLVGYRWYEAKRIPVRFSFGYGLSYTFFDYSSLKVNKKDDSYSVTLTVKNSGFVDGAEVVQIYADKELRGFEKVFLKKGESKKLTISLDDNTFKIYSPIKKAFKTIKGEHVIEAGASIKDIRLSAKVTTDGFKKEELVEEETFVIRASGILEGHHHKGKFTLSDSLIDMSKESKRVKFVLEILKFYVRRRNKDKHPEDPAVKIAVSGIEENPIESLISISGGKISEKLARLLVSWANK